MIGVGVIAGLMALNWLLQDNLWAVLNLWPVLLIVAGLGILLRGRSPWFGAILGVLVVAVIFVAAFAGSQLGLNTTPTLPFEIGTIQFGDSAAERIAGSGNVITEQRPVSGIGCVSMTIPGDLEIQQGAVEALTVSGEDNILPLLLTNMSGDNLVIRWKSNMNPQPRRPLQIKLTVKNLRELVSSSSGNVKVGSLTTGDFRVTLSSSGDIEIDGIQADKTTVNISSSGDVIINGSANQLDLQLTSSGSFQGGDFQTRQAGVNVSSSGNATVWVVDDLNVNITSSGNVHYYGNPLVRQSITSSGDLIPRGNK
jgi:predicted transport protein